MIIKDIEYKLKDGRNALIRSPKDVERILRTFKIKKNVEVSYNGKIII